MSNLFKLNWNDVVKGFTVAVLSTILTGLYQALSNQAVIDPKQLLLFGLTAGLGYVIKNFFTASDGKFLGKL